MERLDMLQSKIALVFPGQGSQYIGMGRRLYETSPAARSIFDRADDILNFPLTRLCFEGPQDQLDDTLNAQPAILTVSIACMAALQERCTLLGREIQPQLVAGHSMGEVTALIAAGVIDFDDGLRLVRERGRLMKESGERHPGGMVAVVGLDDATLAAILAEAQSYGLVTIANNNSPGQAVLSGEIAALQQAMELARQRGARLVQRLAISIAAHSPLMQPAALSFSNTVRQVVLRPPAVPLLSNITAEALTTVEELRQELAEQLTCPVQWTRSIQTAVGAGVETFVELGPRQVLSGLIRRINRTVQSISLTDETLANLWQKQKAQGAP